jgi:hypothetical protein
MVQTAEIYTQMGKRWFDEMPNLCYKQTNILSHLKLKNEEMKHQSIYVIKLSW